MKNTDFMNLSLPEGADKIDVEILNSDFAAIENLLKQHAIVETMTLNGEGVIIGAIDPYIRLQNIDTVQVSIDIGNETFTLASGENMIIRETAENIGIITSGNTHITYFVNPKTYADKGFYTKEKVDELLSKVEGNVEVDAELSDTSENPVQNKVISAKFKKYYNSEEVDELIDGIGTPEDVYTKTETDTLLSAKANKSDTYTKTETDTKITEKVSEIVAGAPEDFDTLKEMSDWLTEHEGSAAEMNTAIQQNKTDILSANTEIAKKVDKVSGKSLIDDTEIERLADVDNYDDTSVNAQIADIYNRCGGGKNIFNFKNTVAIDNYGNTYTKTDDSLTITDTTKVWARTPFPIGVLPRGKYHVSFVVSDLACESNTAKVLIATTADGQTAIGVSKAITQNTKYSFEFNVTSTTQNNYIIFYGNYSNNIYSNKLTFSEIMVSPATVKDDIYTPYVSTNMELQEQINALTARIAALEGTATTAE